ncbi:hypothetical protein V8C42DRAFT_282542 [Trichoderma barbatum]
MKEGCEKSKGGARCGGRSNKYAQGISAGSVKRKPLYCCFSFIRGGLFFCVCALPPIPFLGVGWKGPVLAGLLLFYLSCKYRLFRCCFAVLVPFYFFYWLRAVEPCTNFFFFWLRKGGMQHTTTLLDLAADHSSEYTKIPPKPTSEEHRQGAKARFWALKRKTKR